MIGELFGRLMVISEQLPGRRRLVRCACGTEKTVAARSLLCGDTRSCGCLQRGKAGIQAAAMGKGNVSHGHFKGFKGTLTYNIWHGIKLRCHTPSAPQYCRYGAVGLEVCARWRTSFENFLADMGERPSASYQIDRIDNTKGYEPGNCRWVTTKEQQRNRRSNVLITIHGKTQCAAAWAEEVGIVDKNVIARRIKTGWMPEAAVFTPPIPRGKRTVSLTAIKQGGGMVPKEP